MKEASSFNDQGMVFLGMSDFQAAFEMFEKAMDLVCEGHVDSTIDGRNDTTNASGFDCGNFSTPFPLVRVFSLSETTKQECQAILWYNLALTQQLRSYTEITERDVSKRAALRSYKQAFSLMPPPERIKSCLLRHLLAGLFHNMGCLYNELEDIETAQEYMSKFAEIQQKNTETPEVTLWSEIDMLQTQSSRSITQFLNEETDDDSTLNGDDNCCPPPPPPESPMATPSSRRIERKLRRERSEKLLRERWPSQQQLSQRDESPRKGSIPTAA